MSGIRVASVEYICRARHIDGKVYEDFTEAVLSGPDGRQTVRMGGFHASPDGYDDLCNLYIRHTKLAV